MEFHDEIVIEQTKIMAVNADNSFQYEEVQIKEEIASDSEEIVPVISNGKKAGAQQQSNSKHHVHEEDIPCGLYPLEDNNNNAGRQGSAKHQCENCLESFDSIVRLRRHERKHWMKSCPICDKTVQVDNLKFHIGRMHGSDERCAEKRPFQCTECDKSFFLPNHLLEHGQTHQKASCPVCGESFRPSYLKNHIARKHPDGDSGLSKTPTVYRCSACKQTFARKSLLWTHQQMHKKVECTICNKTFRQDGLKMHMATTHREYLSPSETPSYKCDKCERTFLYKKQLTKHQRYHPRMVKCAICERSFKTNHFKIHTAEEHGAPE